MSSKKKALIGIKIGSGILDRLSDLVFGKSLEAQLAKLEKEYKKVSR